jgi:CheY-like chemotaxis protein
MYNNTDPNTAHPFSLLVVDDNDIARESLEEYLTYHGFRVTLASSGKQCLCILEKQGFDLILMDIQMGEMDGITTMQKKAQMARAKDIPVLALTALAMPGDRERCLAAGAADYISKPVSVNILLTRIKDLLSARQQQGSYTSAYNLH